MATSLNTDSDYSKEVADLILRKYVEQLTATPQKPNWWEVGAKALGGLANQKSISPMGKTLRNLGGLGQGLQQGLSMANPKPQGVDLKSLSAMTALENARNRAMGTGSSREIIPYAQEIVDSKGNVIQKIPAGLTKGVADMYVKNMFKNFGAEFEYSVRPIINPNQTVPRGTMTGDVETIKAKIIAQVKKEFDEKGAISSSTRAQIDKYQIGDAELK